MTMVSEFYGLRDQCEALRAKIAALRATMPADRAKLLDDHKTALDAMNAKVAELTQANAAQVEAIRIAGEKASETGIAITAANATIASLAAKLQKAGHVLGNPAFAAAVGDVEATSATPTWDQYATITDPAKRTAFWNAHETELKTEMTAGTGR